MLVQQQTAELIGDKASIPAVMVKTIHMIMYYH